MDSYAAFADSQRKSALKMLGEREVELAHAKEGLRLAVEFLRGCGPASDPPAWHALMERIDPDYESLPSAQARRWFRS